MLLLKISSIKSFLTQEIRSKDLDIKKQSYVNNFQEDMSFNYELMGRSIYHILSDINFKLAIFLNKFPRGFSIYIANRKSTSRKSNLDNPFVKLRNEEYQNILDKKFY